MGTPRGVRTGSKGHAGLPLARIGALGGVKLAKNRQNASISLVEISGQKIPLRFTTWTESRSASGRGSPAITWPWGVSPGPRAVKVEASYPWATSEVLWLRESAVSWKAWASERRFPLAAGLRVSPWWPRRGVTPSRSATTTS